MLPGVVRILLVGVGFGRVFGVDLGLGLGLGLGASGCGSGVEVRRGLLAAGGAGISGSEVNSGRSRAAVSGDRVISISAAASDNVFLSETGVGIASISLKKSAMESSPSSNESAILLSAAR